MYPEDDSIFNVDGIDVGPDSHPATGFYFALGNRFCAALGAMPFIAATEESAYRNAARAIGRRFATHFRRFERFQRDKLGRFEKRKRKSRK